MSKKHKIQRKDPAPAPVKEKTVPSKQPSQRRLHKTFGSSSLIVFNKATIIFLSVMLVLYLLMSALNLQTSSVGIWEKIFGNEEPESIKAGEPRGIRQDEWMVVTPSLVGQYQLGLPRSNASLGDGYVPVIWNFPVKD